MALALFRWFPDSFCVSDAHTELVRDAKDRNRRGRSLSVHEQRYDACGLAACGLCVDCAKAPATAFSVAVGRYGDGCCAFQSDWRVVLSVCWYVRSGLRQGRVQSVSVHGRLAGGSFDAFSGLAEHLVCTPSVGMPHCARVDVHGKHVYDARTKPNGR